MLGGCSKLELVPIEGNKNRAIWMGGLSWKASHGFCSQDGYNLKSVQNLHYSNQNTRETPLRPSHQRTPNSVTTRQSHRIYGEGQRNAEVSMVGDGRSSRLSSVYSLSYYRPNNVDFSAFG